MTVSKRILSVNILLLLSAVAMLRNTARAGEEAAAKAKAPTLTSEDIVYLKGLLELRRGVAELSADEKLLLERAHKHLNGVKPTPTGKADREEVEERLKEILRASVAGDPDALPPRLDLARFYLYLDRPELAARHLLRAGEGSEQNVFWPLLLTYSYLRSGEVEKADNFLNQANQRALYLLPLRLKKALFCKRVRGLGQYEPRTDTTFSPGEATWIYVEIVGAIFDKLADKKYQLDLDFHMEIRDDFQRTVWERKNYCNFPFEYQHPVHDIFGGMDFLIPENLKPGTHTLILTCEDKESDKKATADITFVIRGADVPPPQ